MSEHVSMHQCMNPFSSATSNHVRLTDLDWNIFFWVWYVAALSVDYNPFFLDTTIEKYADFVYFLHTTFNLGTEVQICHAVAKSSIFGKDIGTQYINKSTNLLISFVFR